MINQSSILSNKLFLEALNGHAKWYPLADMTDSGNGAINEPDARYIGAVWG